MADRPQHRRDTESYGLGQSGYTAGRREGDPALERNIEARNRAYPKGLDEKLLELDVDERWTGRGGSQWETEEQKIAEHPRQDEARPNPRAAG